MAPLLKYIQDITAQLYDIVVKLQISWADVDHYKKGTDDTYPLPTALKNGNKRPLRSLTPAVNHAGVPSPWRGST